MPARPPLVVPEPDQAVLRRWGADAGAGTGAGRRAQRAQIVLLAVQGLPDGAPAAVAVTDLPVTPAVSGLGPESVG